MKLMHPNHGYHIPINDAEEKAMRAVGWVDDDGKALVRKMLALKAKEVEESVDTVESVRAKLEAKGIDYDKRWGLARLLEALK